MAGKTAILSVRILGDARGAVDAMGQAESKAGGLGNVMKGLGGAALGAATVAGGALIGLGVAGVKAAGDLEQSVGAVDTVFKDQAGVMHQYAADAATSMGLTENSYNELATVLGTQLKNGGTAMDQLGGKTNELMGLGADLASMFGGTTTDAVGALSSALKGERDPIERYGVSLNQAAIDAKAAELGFSKTGGALDAQAQQAATLALIMDQTADAQGNFGRETGTFAGQVAILSSQWGNFVSQVGMLLLPVLTSLLTFVTGSIMPGLKAFADVIGPQISGAIGQVAPMLGTFLSSLTSLSGGAAPVQAMFAAMGPMFTQFGTMLLGLLPQITGMFTSMLPPIMAIGTAFLGLLPTLMSFGSAVLPVIVGAVTTLLPLVAQAAGTILPAVIGVVQRLVPIVQQIATTIIPMVVAGIQTLIPKILGVVDPLVSIANTIIGILGPAIDFLLPVVQNVFGQLVVIIGGAIDLIVGVLNTVAALLRGDWAGAWQGVQQIVGAVVSTIQGLVSNAMTFIDRTMGNTIKNIVIFFHDGWNNLVSNVATKISELIGKVQALPGDIKSALGNLGSLLTQAGKDLISGMINGIGSMGQALKDKASGLAGGAVDAIKGTLGIHSPSRVLDKIGRQTGQGFVNGIERLQSGAGRAMADLVTVPDVPRIPLTASVAGGNAGARGPVSIKVEFNGVVSDKVGTVRELRKLFREVELLEGATA